MNAPEQSVNTSVPKETWPPRVYVEMLDKNGIIVPLRLRCEQTLRYEEYLSLAEHISIVQACCDERNKRVTELHQINMRQQSEHVDESDARVREAVATAFELAAVKLRRAQGMDGCLPGGGSYSLNDGAEWCAEQAARTRGEEAKGR